MTGLASFPTGEAGRQPPVRQAGSEHPPHRSTTGRLDALTIKTPLLPRRSGIRMDSAKHYGADMEKRNFDHVVEFGHPDSRRPQRSSRSSLKWVAGLALFSVFSIGIYHNTQALDSLRNAVAQVSSNARAFPYSYQTSADLEGRQSSDSQECTATSNCTRDLVPFKYKPLPVGSIKPLGWLHDQMQGLADGLAGHEHDFYPIVQDSRWTGGNTDYSSLNEGLPYWFNAMVPLAYQLGDERLIGQVRSVISGVLQRQDNTTGWLGPINPDTGKTESADTWGRYPFMLGMIQMAEADPSLAPEIVESLYRFVPYFYKLLGNVSNPNEVWGPARYQDAIITMQWLYENYPQMNGTDQKPLLSNMMYRLKDYGVDWIGYYQKDSYFFQDIDTIQPNIGDDGKGGYFKFLHAVNVGQGLKTPSVDYRFTHNESLLEVQNNAVNWTLQYHGTSAGTIVGDERESGKSPNRGSELCTVVETMFSMAYAYGVTGVNDFADNAERLAFNALPVMMTPDNWAHQYVAQTNQPWAAPISTGGVFWNVGDQGITFGLAPNYPCCAVNHPQGYPKFAAHSFMAVGDDGLAHVLLSPTNVTTKLGNGANVNVAAITDYPFSDILTYKINTDNPFTFYVRVPGWASSPAITVNGQQTATNADSNSLAAISIPAGQTTVQYVLQSSLRVVPRANDTIAVYHGALLYALDVGYKPTFSNANSAVTRNKPPTNDPAIQIALAYNTNVNLNAANAPAQAREWNISNTMAWSYVIDPDSLKYFASNDSSDGKNVNSYAVTPYHDEATGSDSPPALPNPIWDYQAPAQYVKAVGCLIEWPLRGNTPDIPPAVNKRDCTTNSTVELILRPYGSLKVHMAELPARALGAPSVNGSLSR